MNGPSDMQGIYTGHLSPGVIHRDYRRVLHLFGAYRTAWVAVHNCLGSKGLLYEWYVIGPGRFGSVTRGIAFVLGG